MHSTKILHECSYASYLISCGILIYKHNKYPFTIKAGIIARDSDHNESIRVVGKTAALAIRKAFTNGYA